MKSITKRDLENRRAKKRSIVLGLAASIMAAGGLAPQMASGSQTQTTITATTPTSTGQQKQAPAPSQATAGQALRALTTGGNDAPKFLTKLSGLEIRAIRKMKRVYPTARRQRMINNSL